MIPFLDLKAQYQSIKGSALRSAPHGRPRCWQPECRPGFTTRRLFISCRRTPMSAPLRGSFLSLNGPQPKSSRCRCSRS